MKKNNITLVFVAIVFSIIVGMIIGKSLLKYKEGEPDVVGSFSMNRDENLTVVVNRKNISDKEASICKSAFKNVQREFISFNKIFYRSWICNQP